MNEKSCGTIPYTVKQGEIYYLLIRSGRRGSYGFPKGHVEMGERERDTALRETFEETSLQPVIKDGFRHRISYRLGNGNQKEVVYFLADYLGGCARHNPGFEKFEYFEVTFGEAMKMICFSNLKNMLEKANSFLLEEIKCEACT